MAGDRPTVDGHPYPAFPRPERLLELEEMRGLSATKVAWLHGLARATLDGRLDTEVLRAMPRDEALAALNALPGVGPWTAEAVRLRGCGMVDELPANDETSRRAISQVYGLDELGPAAFEQLAEAWRPYRMWAVVLLRFSANRRDDGPGAPRDLGLNCGRRPSAAGSCPALRRSRAGGPGSR